MTDNLPPMQYLDEAAKAFEYKDWHHAQTGIAPTTIGQRRIIAHARALHRIAELEAKLQKMWLEDVARREARETCTSTSEEVWYVEGFLRAAEMAKKGELPDEHV